MAADFKRDLAKGKLAEDKFAVRFPELTRTSGFEGDFIMPCGSVLELKNDSYCPDKWPNFILERYRSKDRNGGVWQAQDHGAKYFGYNFTKNNLLFLFDTEQLIVEAEIVIKELNLQLQGISNGSYETRFYRVPRAMLTHIELGHSLLGKEVT